MTDAFSLGGHPTRWLHYNLCVCVCSREREGEKEGVTAMANAKRAKVRDVLLYPEE